MNNKAQFTPGPWVVHTFTISGKEKLEVLDATGTNACVQANAHLIAAAPVMYEALVRFAKAIKAECYDEDILVDIYHDVRDALAQAEGRQA